MSFYHNGFNPTMFVQIASPVVFRAVAFEPHRPWYKKEEVAEV
jgi:hypothetical protein